MDPCAAARQEHLRSGRITIDGAESAMGGPTTMASDGSNVRNLLHTFGRVFDTM
jgi:hypothetical protein